MTVQPTETRLTESVFAVRASMADGSTLDLLLFAQRAAAVVYMEKSLKPLPLGFDSISIIERRVIGTVDRRRVARVVA